MLLGRPTKFNVTLAEEILSRLAEGETLREICRDEHMPARSAVSRWVRDKPDFQDQVARAREFGTWSIVDETREIADDGTNDWMKKRGRDGQSVGWVLNGEAVQRSKLRIEQRWREAEALAPKVYGKRQTIEHAGGIHITTGDNSDEIMAEIMELLASGRVKLPAGIQLEEGDAEEPEIDEDDFSDIA